jgi:hypothetical protein
MLNGVFPLVVKIVGEKIFPTGQNPNAYKMLMSSGGQDSGPGIEGSSGSAFSSPWRWSREVFSPS